MSTRTNADWLESLQARDQILSQALQELREALRKAMLAYLHGHAVARQEIHSVEARMLAEDCVQEALMDIQRNLASFRGDSQFMTWAYAITLRRLLAQLRKRRWSRQALPTEHWGRIKHVQLDVDSEGQDPHRLVQRQQLFELLARLIETELSERQRYVLVAHAFQDVPLDHIAQQLGANRDAVYKVLHDARKKLKLCLLARNLSLKDFA
jgi:RNA polymerase sigma-70 factor, ECF subfamily